ncbi:hypothetical protein KO529_10010 [Arenibacter algicola]|uniref:primase-helicase family protein n=1 Tax=Arenibacter algicola TaxID=616991 RepID=UPI001C068411|nr:primase-helicase family protein [Arenibacter algicola]MBU2905118.1 hypothetical protein [Arenibacter algicola]
MAELEIKSLAKDENKKNSIEKGNMPFWTIASDGKVKIKQYELTKFLEKGGFCKTATKNGISVVRVENNIVSDAPDHEMIDYIKGFLTSNKQAQVLEAFSTGVSTYINKGKNNLLRTVQIPIDKDPKDEAWFYYKNTAVKVTMGNIEEVEYEHLPHKIWDSRILKRDYKPANGLASDFYKFMYNLAGQNSERIIALMSIFGYLLHRYQNTSLTRAVIFVDENISFDGKANGGSGKTLLTEALSKMRELVGMDGKNIKTGSWFRNQRITPTTDLVRYDDVQRDFSLETMYSMITSGVTVERKYEHEFYIRPENAPKFIVSSNYPVKGTGGSTDERRRCEFEVANYYSVDHQPKDDFKKNFFSDWNSDEWNTFDALMMDCVQVYFQKGLIIPDPINLVKNKLINDTSEEFVSYMDDSIDFDKWIDKRECHQSFLEKYPIHKDVTSHQFTKWLKAFASHKQLEYDDKSSGGKYIFILKTIKMVDDEK